VLPFAKYHGLGNDFVIIDGAAPLSGEVVRRLCDRHRGIGADGVLTVSEDAEADAHMWVSNADGSQSAMCGNGLRCVARYLYDAGRVPVTHGELDIRAGEAVYRCERRAADRFRVSLGKAVFAHADLPGAELDLESHGQRFHLFAVHLGNPHAVIFTDGGDLATLVATHGAGLARDRAFPNGVNVSFVRSCTDGFEVAVYERGVGPTLACGSGAAAVAAAAVHSGRWTAGKGAAIHLPGGVLTVEVDAGARIVMEGEATRVFAGEVRVP